MRQTILTATFGVMFSLLGVHPWFMTGELELKILMVQMAKFKQISY